MVFGLRQDGRLEMLMSKDGLTLEQTKELARRRGLVSAYLPDHASKSRLIIPRVKGFTEDDANWISGGATSFVHVPYLLRLSERRTPLNGSLMDNISLKNRIGNRCTNPLDCSRWVAGRLLDRSLAGLNRVMEKGVEPVARMIWPPTTTPSQQPNRDSNTSPKSYRHRAPLPEPPITADPLILRESLQPTPPELETDGTTSVQLEEEDQLRPTLPPDLPPPLFLADPEPVPPIHNTKDNGVNKPPSVTPNGSMERFYDAPPPPILPPPLP
jgi:hypothetical protein